MAEEISRGKFIRLGAAMGATSALVACGGGAGDESSGQTPPDEASQPTGGGGSGDEVIAATSEVAPGSAIDFENSGQPAVLVHLEGGDFVAYSAVCTHQRCTVAYQGGELVCPCHGSTFDPSSDAEVVAGPANRPLERIPVEVRDGEVLRA